MALLGSCLNYFRISLPWTLTSIPFAAALVIIGKFASRRARFLARYSWAVLVAGAVLTLIVSHYFRLDMAYNQVFPVSVTIIGAISGTVMVFVSSMLISKNENVISKLLSKVGKETMMILALSQLVIKMLKEYTDYGSFARYGLLIIVLFVFKYIKDYLNNFIGFKLF